jgi:hypothetical protein
MSDVFYRVLDGGRAHNILCSCHFCARFFCTIVMR